MKSFKDYITEKDDSEYDKFFNKMLKKYNVDSPEDLSSDKKKEFFDAVDKGWKGDNEQDED